MDIHKHGYAQLKRNPADWKYIADSIRSVVELFIGKMREYKILQLLWRGDCHLFMYISGSKEKLQQFIDIVVALVVFHEEHPGWLLRCQQTEGPAEKPQAQIQFIQTLQHQATQIQQVM